MRELKEGTYTLTGLVSMGGPAKLTIAAGERLTEEQFKAVPSDDRKLFKQVRAETSPAKGAPAEPAPAAGDDQ